VLDCGSLIDELHLQANDKHRSVAAGRHPTVFVDVIASPHQTPHHDPVIDLASVLRTPLKLFPSIDCRRLWS